METYVDELTPRDVEIIVASMVTPTHQELVRLLGCESQLTQARTIGDLCRVQVLVGF